MYKRQELITRIIAEAGAPAGLFQNLHAPVEAIAGIIADRRVAAVTLTGSPAAGGKVAAQAGATRTGATDPGGSDHSDDSVNPADSFRWTLDQDSLFVEFGSSTLSA